MIKKNMKKQQLPQYSIFNPYLEEASNNMMLIDDKSTYEPITMYSASAKEFELASLFRSINCAPLLYMNN